MKKYIEKYNDIPKTEVKRNQCEADIMMPLDEKIEETKKCYDSTIKFLKKKKITISTITLDCKLHTLINVDEFAKNVRLQNDGILSVTFGNRKDAATNRTIIALKQKKKIRKRNFYNQVTVLIRPTSNLKRKPINIKVFKNGSLQMTGCRDMDEFYSVTNILITILKKTYNRKKNGIITKIKFIESPDAIGIFDVKIRMINSNFRVGYKIDRKNLAKILRKNHGPRTSDTDIGHVEFKYTPTEGHSCVNIKYQYNENNNPSIFVFQTGAIIITGVKNLHQIVMAYTFIKKILKTYHSQIKIVPLDPALVRIELIKFYKSQPTNYAAKYARIC